MKRFFPLLMLLMFGFVAQSLADVEQPICDWSFETIVDGQRYYLYNIAAEKFLNDANAMDDEPTVGWTVEDTKLKSDGGKYVSLTSKNTGSLLKPNWVFTAASDATEAATNALTPFGEAYYGIGNRINISTIIQQMRYLAVAEDGTLMLSEKTGDDLASGAQWLFISQEQVDNIKNPVDFTALVAALEAYEAAFTEKQAHMGFYPGEYAPYTDNGLQKAFEEAHTILNQPLRYKQADVDAVVEKLGQSWEANTEMMNAVAPDFTAADLGQTFVYGTETGCTMPLRGGQVYELTFSTSADVTITLRHKGGDIIATATCSAATDDVCYRFFVPSDGDYTLTLTSSAQAQVTDLSILPQDEASEELIPGSALEAGQKFYLFNLGSGLFISAGAEDAVNTPTAMKNNHATLFTVVENTDGTYTFKHGDEALGIVIATSILSATPTSLLASASANEGTSLVVEGDEKAYTLHVQKKWGLTGNYTGYLAATPDLTQTGDATLDVTSYEHDVYARWILVSEATYETLAQAREEAIERLEAALQKAKAVQAEIEDLPGLSKLTFGASITIAEIMLRNSQQGGWLNPLISTSRINSTAQSLEEQADSLAGICDYYVACLGAIDNINRISSGAALRTLTTTAKASLQIATSKSAMLTAMKVLRAGVMVYMQTIDTFSNGQDFTGLIANQSFETGDAEQWFSLGLDKVTGGSDDDTFAIKNVEPNYIEDADKKYYLQAGNLMMQAILGLPEGVFELSAKVAADGSLLNLGKNVTMNATLVSLDDVKQFLTDVLPPTEDIPSILSGITSGNVDLGKLLQNVKVSDVISFLTKASTRTKTVNCKNALTFSDLRVRFLASKDDVLLLSLNSGAVPFVHVDKFRMDDVRLTYVRSANDILDVAKAQLRQALEGQQAVKANYPTEESETVEPQAAFTFDKALTEQYNSALAEAQNINSNVGLSDIKGRLDLDHIEDNTSLEHFFDAEVAALEKAKADFEQKAFIAPRSTEAFNIIMKDNWVVIFGSKWTGNAVTMDENQQMAFSRKPGESPLTMAFGFERADAETTNRLYAFAFDAESKFYLCEQEGRLALTEEISEALPVTALLSRTEEGELALKSGDLYLGTGYTSNAFVKTNEGSTLAPARVGLTIVPAAEMTVPVRISAEQRSAVRHAATLMLPFDAVPAEGLDAYSITAVKDKNVIVKGEAVEVLKANTPYYIEAAEGDYDFRGVAHALFTSYSDGLLVGSYTNYSTQSDEYKLVEMDGYSAFVRQENQGIVPFECYMKIEASEEADAVVFLDESSATAITQVKATTDGREEAYDLMGRKVNAKQTKGVLIVGGRKIVR